MNKLCDVILVVVDKFTKYALYIVTHKKLIASEFADLFFYYIFYAFSDSLTTITSDKSALLKASSN